LDEEVLNILDHYLGDIIDRVVRKYRYNVDLDEEYPELLRYIYRRLIKSWFNGRKPSLEELEAALRDARKNKKMLEVLLSFLVSRYAAKHGRVYLQRGDWREEYY
jgi:hypothetical protein